MPYSQQLIGLRANGAINVKALIRSINGEVVSHNLTPTQHPTHKQSLQPRSTCDSSILILLVFAAVAPTDRLNHYKWPVSCKAKNLHVRPDDVTQWRHCQLADLNCYSCDRIATVITLAAAVWLSDIRRCFAPMWLVSKIFEWLKQASYSYCVMLNFTWREMKRQESRYKAQHSNEY